MEKSMVFSYTFSPYNKNGEHVDMGGSVWES
jgi:hypothetical protein